MVGAYVRVLPQVLIAGRTQWLAGAVAVTDDRGAYRIAGLGPGKYVVSVPSMQATLPVGATIKPPGAWSGTSHADLRDGERSGKRLNDSSSMRALAGTTGRRSIRDAASANTRRPSNRISDRVLPERRDARGLDARRTPRD